MKFRKVHTFYLIIIILIITIFSLLWMNSTAPFDNCSSIEKGIERDNCYIEFVLEGNYNVCKKISNEYTRRSCLALKSSKQSQKDIILIENILPQPIKP